MYSYLLRGLAIDRSNQDWAVDANYIPMARGFVYLITVVDWTSRKVLAAKITKKPSRTANNRIQRFVMKVGSHHNARQ